jgi:hypothetical protein
MHITHASVDSANCLVGTGTIDDAVFIILVNLLNLGMKVTPAGPYAALSNQRNDGGVYERKFDKQRYSIISGVEETW